MAFTVLEMPKRLDSASVAKMQDAVRKTFRTGANLIVFDFAGCGFIDSRGLSVVVTGLKQAQQTGKKLRLVHVGEEIRLLLRVTRFDRICDIHESMESAVDETEING
ncbi:MAG: STAS domain-containing protein [Acidobacteriota bacterium]|nr:STAS domain-containing protein [Acidobacteriota bacterium]